MKKPLCWLAILVSNLLILVLVFRLHNQAGSGSWIMFFVAPVLFTVPWLVIMRDDK